MAITLFYLFSFILYQSILPTLLLFLFFLQNLLCLSLPLRPFFFFFFSFVYLLLDHYKRIHNFTIIIFLKISLILCVNSEYLIRFSFFFFNNFHSDTIVILKLFLLRTYKFFVNNFVILNFLCYPIANYLSIG